MLMLATVAIFCLHSCEPDSWDKIYVPEEQEGQEGRAEYEVNVSGIIGEEQGTKSILGTDSESNPFIKDSGYQVLAFNRRAGILEAVVSVDSRTASAKLKLGCNDTYDFFVVGNLWFLDSAGKKKGWDVFFGKIDRYPARAADMKDASLMPYYRFDGEALGSTGLRTEKFSDVATYGIPYSGKKEGVTYENSRRGVSVPVKRLFSKVTLTVDHSGLIGPSGNVNAFVNESIRLRQVNCRVHPFIEGVTAAEGDILEDAADRELNPENGSSKTFVFYVPENCGGNYTSVTKASDKKPSVAGSKSGCVTYLEFVGELKPELAGGYGGTLKYQFCLGGNATSDYNVVRNSNYKVTLGFKPESLFEDVDWKLDKGESLTDTRVLGLSADAAGTQRLKEDGTQVIAVRSTDISSKRKEMYLFFNHNGGTENELTSYVDEYTTGYKPADATRSAVKVTFEGNNADAVRCAYDKSTGKVSFWTDSPTALTPGHEYPVTFTLYPGGKTVSALVKTVAPMEVKFNTSKMLVGMKRGLAPVGFCGANLTLKVISGGENILRYSNSAASDGGPGTDKYVTKKVEPLSGMSVPLYAYRPGSVTLAVSSDDTFNDKTVSVSVNVSKPEPRYDKIKENVPMWNPATESIEYGYGILLPFDGTPVDVPAYYTADGWSSTPVTVGDGEDQFDFGVYAQLLDFVFTFTSDCVAKDPETLRIFLQKWWLAPDCLFETYVQGTLEFMMNEGLDLYMKVFQNRVKIAPRSTEIYSSAYGFQTYVTTLIPGFYDITQKEEGAVYKGYKHTSWKESDIESDYFNYWNDGWSAWKTEDDIQPDVMRAQWPKITNSIGFYRAGCSLSSLELTNVGSHDGDGNVAETSEILGLKLEGEGDAMTLNWSFAPGESEYFYENIDVYGCSYAPYGNQKVKIRIKNIHSGEVFPPEGYNQSLKKICETSSFNLKYGTVNLAGYLFYEDRQPYAEFICSAPLCLAGHLLNKANTTGYTGMIAAPLSAFDNSLINCGVPSGVKLSDPYSFEFFYESFQYGNVASIEAKYAAWAAAGVSRGSIDSYNNAKWNDDLAKFCYQSNVSLPVEYVFKKSGMTERYYTLPRSLCRNEEIPDYISFSFDRVSMNNQIRCLGYMCDE